MTKSKSEKEKMGAAIEYCKENIELDIIHNQIANVTEDSI